MDIHQPTTKMPPLTVLNNAVMRLCQKVSEGRTDWETEGRIRVTQNDAFGYIFNYKDDVQYAGNWTPLEMVCRGLVISPFGEVLARPFDKFFNWFERGYKASGHMTYVTTKMDGSLIIGYRDDDEFFLNTRGSFENDQVHLAYEIMGEKCITMDKLAEHCPHLTLMMELIHPSNRIVVNYGYAEELYLLAARNTLTGEYLPHFPDLIELADKIGLEVPAVWSFNKVEDILESCRSLPASAEGYVAEFSDGTRWKFKGDAYRELHKLAFGLTEQRVARMMQNGSYTYYFDKVPKHIQDEMLGHADYIRRKIHEQDMLIRGMFAGLTYQPVVSRKDFALKIKANPVLSPYAPYLFALWEGREICEMLLNDYS